MLSLQQISSILDRAAHQDITPEVYRHPTEYEVRWNEPPVLPTSEYHLAHPKFPLPILKPFKLKPHQLRVIQQQRHMELHPHEGSVRGCIFDLEMGLGKTLSALAHVLATHGVDKRPSLFLCEPKILHVIVHEAHKFFADHCRLVVYKRGAFLGKHLRSGYHILLMTYDDFTALAHTHGWLPHRKSKPRHAPEAKGILESPWARIIVDESQKLRNVTTDLFQSLAKMKPGYRLCLSGTPMRTPDDYPDLFAQLAFCGLQQLPERVQQTKDHFLQRGLHRCVVSMTYQSVGLQMPQMTEHYVEVKLDDQEKAFYNTLLKEFKTLLNPHKGSLNMGKKKLNTNTMYLRLRQMCVAPYLVRDHPGAPEWTKIRSVFSSKIRTLCVLTRRTSPKAKILVFTEWTEASKLTAEALRATHPDGSVHHLDSHTADPDHVLNLFYTDPRSRILVATYVAAKGLNLSAANYCFLMEPRWCQDLKEQAYHRVFRIGQQRDVMVINLVVAGTAEYKLTEMSKDAIPELQTAKATTEVMRRSVQP